MRLLLIMIIALSAVSAEANERKVNEIFRCAEVVADHLELDFDKFEIGIADNMGSNVLGATAHMNRNYDYTYVFFNDDLLEESFGLIHQTVAHELIHVEQTQRGDLKGSYWKGQDQKGKRYKKQGHERDALKHDDDLAKLCK